MAAPRLRFSPILWIMLVVKGQEEKKHGNIITQMKILLFLMYNTELCTSLKWKLSALQFTRQGRAHQRAPQPGQRKPESASEHSGNSISWICHALKISERVIISSLRLSDDYPKKKLHETAKDLNLEKLLIISSRRKLFFPLTPSSRSTHEDKKENEKKNLSIFMRRDENFCLLLSPRNHTTLFLTADVKASTI